MVICLKNGKISPRCWKQKTDLLCLYQDVNVMVKSLVSFHIDNNHRSFTYFIDRQNRKDAAEKEEVVCMVLQQYSQVKTVKTKYSEVDLYLTLYVVADIRRKLN